MMKTGNEPANLCPTEKPCGIIGWNIPSASGKIDLQNQLAVFAIHMADLVINITTGKWKSFRLGGPKF
jgi:hypothetical protein